MELIILSEEFIKLKEIASSPVCTGIYWVTQEWAEDHFGSEAEAKFVVAANPDTIVRLIAELERLEQENEKLRFGNIKLGFCT